MPEAKFTTWAECPQKRWVIEVKTYVELPISFFPRLDNLEGEKNFKMKILREPVPLPSGNFTISMNANGTYVTSSPIDVGNLNWNVIKTVLTEE
jgi:hypothetical protein